MRIIAVLVALFFVLVCPEAASSYACNHGSYVNSSGRTVHSPSCGGAGEGTPHAVCRDGSISYSEHRLGTCSRHGGVASWK